MKRALDALDLVIDALRAHEKRLDWLAARMEELVAVLEESLKRLEKVITGEAAR